MAYKKYKHGGPHDPNLAKVKKGLKYVESSNGLQMTNPKSSATGFYGQLYNAEELQNISYLQGVDRNSFASDTTLQNRLFEDRYFNRIPDVPGLKRNASELRAKYESQLTEKGIPFNYTDDEISALTNLLGREGTRKYFGNVLRDGKSLAEVLPRIYGPNPEAPNKTPEKYLETYREGRDLKYGGNMKKYNNNIPQAGFGDMFKKLGKQITAGGAGIIEGVSGGLLPATKLLSDSHRDAYGAETQMGSRFGNALGILGGAGAFSGASAGAAVPGAGFSSVPGANSFNAIYGGGINPALMNPALAGSGASASAAGANNLLNMGNNFGTGELGSGMFNMFQQEQDNSFGGYAMGGTATNPPFMSAMNPSSTGPAEEPIERINELKAQLKGYEETYMNFPMRRYGSSTLSSMRHDALLGKTRKPNAELERLTGKKSSEYGSHPLYIPERLEDDRQKRFGYNKGGTATNMKQNMGQDINVESGELLMSASGGQFQSMNPKAPMQEVMPGVSLVKGNQSNDNVPIKIPDGETMVFSKRLGYADKGLELVKQYKSIKSSPDSNDFISQQTKTFQLKKINEKLQALFKEQESSKSKKINKQTGVGEIPGAFLGDLFQKGKDFVKSDSFKDFGNKALTFAKDNPEALYNVGMGMFGKDPQQYNAEDYQTQYSPDPAMTNINTGALLAPINNQVNASRYAINQSGASPSEIIAANMAVGAKAGPQLAAAEAKGQMLQNQMNLGVYDKMFKADSANNMLDFKTRMMNDKMSAVRPSFFKEAISDIGQYRAGKDQENFMRDMYNQRFGNMPTQEQGQGQEFNFSLGNMSQPSLGNNSLFGNFSGLNMYDDE